MKISVNRDDIAKGDRFDPDLCPVALALTRAGLCHFGVFGVAFLIASGDWVALLGLPDAVSKWIASFDSGHPVGPVKFDLELPNETIGNTDRPLEAARAHLTFA